MNLNDLGPVEVECPSTKYNQDETHTNGIYEAEDELYSGYNVGAPFPATTGNVYVVSNNTSIPVFHLAKGVYYLILKGYEWQSVKKVAKE